MGNSLIKILLIVFLSNLLTITLIDFIFEDEYKIFKTNFKTLLKKESFDKSCLPKIIKKIPPNSTVIIGHAYGSRRHQHISKKVKIFLENQKNNILSVIFTGDVFYYPTLKKWDELNQDKIYKIYISPGNHDVGIDEEDYWRRDVFEIANSKYQKKSLPYIIKENNSIIVITDSSKTKLEFKKIIDVISEYKNNHIVLSSHHVLVKEMNRFANAKRSANQILDKKFIEKQLSQFKKITFIYGDGGNPLLPSIACFEHKNINHLINGVGDKRGDKLIILKDEKIYQYKL